MSIRNYRKQEYRLGRYNHNIIVNLKLRLKRNIYMIVEMADKQPIARVGVNVSLLPKARDVIEKIREQTGVPQTEALKRILEWYASQKPLFRQAILTGDPESRQEFSRALLEQWARGPMAKVSSIADQKPPDPKDFGFDASMINADEEDLRDKQKHGPGRQPTVPRERTGKR